MVREQDLKRSWMLDRSGDTPATYSRVDFVNGMPRHTDAKGTVEPLLEPMPAGIAEQMRRTVSILNQIASDHPNRWLWNIEPEPEGHWRVAIVVDGLWVQPSSRNFTVWDHDPVAAAERIADVIDLEGCKPAAYYQFKLGAKVWSRTLKDDYANDTPSWTPFGDGAIRGKL